MLRALAVLSVLATLPAGAHAKCARFGIVADVFDAPDTLPTAGGIVVGYTHEQDGDLDDGDVAVQTAWRFRVGSSAFEPKIESLAPGLAVYRLPAATGDVALIDDARKPVAKVKVSRDPHKALPAPRIKQVRYDEVVGRRGSITITVELDGAAPSSAVALVMVDLKGNPLSWGRVEAEDDGDDEDEDDDKGQRREVREVRVLGTYRCRALPNGTRIAKPGDKVTLFWVDRAGVKSAATKAIAIKQATVEKDED